MSLRFAFYGRVSTEDAQDPEASRSWQKRRAIDLISPHGGVLAADYFDIGQSRSLPWKRRPEASRLLADVTSRGRGFDAVARGAHRFRRGLHRRPGERPCLGHRRAGGEHRRDPHHARRA